MSEVENEYKFYYCQNPTFRDRIYAIANHDVWMFYIDSSDRKWIQVGNLFDPIIGSMRRGLKRKGYRSIDKLTLLMLTRTEGPNE